jgi:type IV pilus assembly protein PilA
MLARFRRAMEEKDQGFTLIELLVVIIIIGILAAIAIPVFLNQRKKGVDASIKSDLKALATIEETYLTDNTSAVGTATAADLTDFKKSTGNVIEVAVTAGKGYCLRGSNPGGTAVGTGGTFFWYDSAAGGLKPASAGVPTGGVACTGTPAFTALP